MALKKIDIVINNDAPDTNASDVLETPRDVIIAMVLDSSGSMSHLVHSVIEGFNSFKREQEEVPADTTVTLCTFDSVVTFPFTEIPIADLPDLTTTNYRPSGSTALYDAILATQDRIDNYLVDHPGLNVIFVITTDGEENASRATRQQVFDMIREKTEAGWVFTYLSADADAFANANSIGIASQNAVQWAATPDAYAASALTSNMATSSYRYSRSGSFSLAAAAATVMAENATLDSSALKISPDVDTTVLTPPLTARLEAYKAQKKKKKSS